MVAASRDALPRSSSSKACPSASAQGADAVQALRADRHRGRRRRIPRPSSVRRAAARARCSTSSPDSKRRPPAASCSTASRSPDPVRERGVVFQQGALFTWMSVLDNVAFGPRALGKSVAEAREHRRSATSSWSVSPASRTAIRTSSPAACSSASASRARSRTSPKCC